MFATHAVLSVDAVLSSVTELLRQSLHASAPVVDLYLSAAQAVGVSPLAPEKPMLATHAVLAIEPATLLLLAGHDPEQDVAVSVPALYVSAPQFSHVVPLLF